MSFINSLFFKLFLWVIWCFAGAWVFGMLDMAGTAIAWFLANAIGGALYAAWYVNEYLPDKKRREREEAETKRRQERGY